MIVSKENVKDRAEVFTNKREVNDMLDAVADTNKEIKYDLSVLDPAIGYGAFLDAVIARKVSWLERNKAEDMEDFYKAVELFEVVLKTSFAVDINEYSIEIARRIIGERVSDWFIEHFGELDGNVFAHFKDIISKQVVVGNYLTGLDPAGQPIPFIDPPPPQPRKRKAKAETPPADYEELVEND